MLDSISLELLLDFLYYILTENMDDKQCEEIDSMLFEDSKTEQRDQRRQFALEAGAL